MTGTLQELYLERVADGDLARDDVQLGVLDRLQDVRDALERTSVRRGFLARLGRAPEPPKGLYLWGGVGRGKSMLMDLFFDATDIDRKRRVHFHAFMQEIHRGMHAARQRGVDDAIKPVADSVAAQARLLCFDEMQITDITDAMIVGRLFGMLFDRGVTVVTTSNRVPDDLYKDGLNRQLFLPFIDLIKDRLQVIPVDGVRDYRQDRLRGRPVYFSPADASAQGEMDALWDEIAGGAPEPMTLQVGTRTVTLERTHNGVARASFDELCGKPLGPADFLAIAAAVRVLMLESIPTLSRARNNEAKRFVTLIDALYEARVVLIASAAAEPEDLYKKGAGAFEFERTASRLREMQADDWGA